MVMTSSLHSFLQKYLLSTQIWTAIIGISEFPSPPPKIPIALKKRLVQSTTWKSAQVFPLETQYFVWSRSVLFQHTKYLNIEKSQRLKFNKFDNFHTQWNWLFIFKQETCGDEEYKNLMPLMLRHLYTVLLLQHQCKYQYSEKGKYYLRTLST